MSAALLPSSFILLVVAFATAEPQLNVVGEGLMSNPVTSTAPGKGMRYAGPIVYTNEKPPIIFFPPPPKDAKPGLNFGQGLSFFGKSKSPKSIKYVPMPHHDLPVLIYTSDKTPPIHMVHPPHNVHGGPAQGPSSFGPPKDDFGPPPGSLASTYRGIFPEASSARVVTSSYEIPSTSYGTPMKAFGGSLDFQSSSSSEGNAQQQHSTISFGQPSIYEGQSNKKPPHIMYSGHPPIHIFNQPDTFVRAPKEIPLTSYEELPPKASYGPPKSSFGPPSGSAFSAPPRHHRRPIPGASPFGSPQRPGSPYLEENLIFAGSSNNPTSVHTPKNNNQASAQSSISYVGGNGGSPPAASPTYSFGPQQNAYSFGPFSVEYGPPSEPFMSFSEPTGSLSSFYGEANSENGNVGGGAGSEDGWMPGPPPTDIGEGQMKENEWNGPPPQHAHSPPGYNGPPQQAYQPSSYKGPSPMHSVFLPSSNSRPRPHHHHPLPYGGSKLANLFSNFKLKRSKPKYAIAPKSMHKPPIIIYYGKKPPVHVYQKPETEEAFIAAGSSPSISVTTAESGRNAMGSDNGNGNEAAHSSTSYDNVDLTYGASQNTEVRVTSPAISSISSDAQNMEEGKPAIIPARPVDIFSSSELQPSIYMARNSLNTIFVSDLSGSGTKALKTFIVRRSEGSSQNPGKLSVAEATVYPPPAQQQQEGSLIISNIAQNRISGEQVLALSQQQEQQELTQVPISDPESNVHVDLEQLSQQEEEEVEDNKGESSNEIPTTTILVVPSKTGEEIENENKAKEQSAESRNVQVAVIRSPSSFQTSLSQAEKEAEAQSESSS